MIYVSEVAGTAGEKTFVVMPNRCMSWRWLVGIYCVLATVSLAIAMYFYMLGLPLVLPFSGIEVFFLGAALYVTAWRSDWREVITINDNDVIVETGRRTPVSAHQFQRPWTRLVLARPGGWYPSRLLLRSYGRQVELGRFINEQERQGLAEMLAGALGQGLESK